MKKFSMIALSALILLTAPVFSKNNYELPIANVKSYNNTPVLFSLSSFQIGGINPNAETNPNGAYYPGFRGSNQLIIYTEAFGDRTGTNEFGMEAIIEKNRVVKLSGANSPIPKNGFVISGHGKAKQWITNNIIEGAKISVDLDKGLIESSITPESYVFRATYRYNESRKLSNNLLKGQPKNSDYVLTTQNYLKNAQKYVKKANKSLKENNYQKVYNYTQESLDLANKAFYNAVPNNPNEFKGIWVRPTEKNREDIEKTLDKISHSGIDNVFLETYYHGYTIFPSKTMESYGITNQKKEFQGFDPLAVWIEEAHKRNMKLHVWFQTFYVGTEPKTAKYKNIISVYPEWGNIQRRAYLESNPTKSELEHGGYFLDPANPNVQKYLSDLVSEIVNKYKIDGLNIDYIRYPASLGEDFPNYLGSTWGYTVYARKEFKKLYGVDPVYISKTESYWDKWVLYRQNKVTEFVEKVSQIVKDKNIMLSAVVFPDTKEAEIKKLQNWKCWASSNYINSFTPLVLGGDEELMSTYMTDIKQSVPADVKILPGIFQPFNSETPYDLLKQFVKAREKGADGVVIFDYAHFNDEFKNALMTRTFKPLTDK